VLGSLPFVDRSTRIERRALQIEDPVERLRYLRREMASVRVKAKPSPHRARRIPYVIGIILVMITAIAPGSAPKGTAEVTTMERRLLVPAVVSTTPASYPVPRVWLVDHTATLEQYSNGLRVDLTFAVSNRPRTHFPIFSLARDGTASKTGSGPVGIVYHTTESLLASFQEDETHRLKQLGRNLLEVVRQGRSYHYVIDRFGRVFRVVGDSEAANHAGTSVWADASGIYVNLNDSFLAVAFEAQTGATDEVTPAQILAAKVLTEMLRARYGIAAENCVTHAQVSVNPLNMRIGSHTDWAGNFPFSELGLPDNYSIPLPSLYAFGFNYDDTFVQATGGGWKGLDLAEDQVQRQAEAEQLPVIRYRAILQHRYKDIAAALKHQEYEGGT
jgi:hypothetical protein